MTLDCHFRISTQEGSKLSLLFGGRREFPRSLSLKLHRDSKSIVFTWIACLFEVIWKKTCYQAIVKHRALSSLWGSRVVSPILTLVGPPSSLHPFTGGSKALTDSYEMWHILLETTSLSSLLTKWPPRRLHWLFIKFSTLIPYLFFFFFCPWDQ